MVKYRKLGRTGVEVSCLCYGTEGITADKFHRCREAGINFFDSANVYDDGRAEEVLGDLIQGCRDEVVISSKVCFPVDADVNSRGLSRRHIMLQVECSLRRLRTDRIDIYYFHSYDPSTALEETLRAVDDLVSQGKILYPAASNWAAWQIAIALGISRREGWAPLACIEPMYSLVKRQAEVELLPLAMAENLGVFPYSPIAGGLLSGKYTMAEHTTDGRLSHDDLSVLRYGDPLYYEIAERFAAHANERGVHPAPLALAWVMSHPAVTAPIFGARTSEQLEVILTALDIAMTPEWRAEISALSVEPARATDRREEQFGYFFKDWEPG